MKRDPNIVPLSRDHHHGLLFCWKIRQGMAKSIDPGRMSPYVVYFWKTHLKEHFEQEETLLFQALDHPLCLRAQDEHRRIDYLAAGIGDGSKAGLENFIELADLLENHIRFEERELFPLLEARLPKERLSEIGAQLNQLHDQPVVDDYEDAFWM